MCEPGSPNDHVGLWRFLRGGGASANEPIELTEDEIEAVRVDGYQVGIGLDRPTTCARTP